MGRIAKDITGETFGRLTALRDTGKRTYGHVWEFLCACGKVHIAVKSEVTKSKGGVRSCGCAPNSGRFNTTHGDTGTPTYSSWRGMLDRCYQPSADNYSNYGGRGITVCDAWREDYSQFKADMGERPQGMTIDRIDNQGMYEPSNCKWSTSTEQAYNKANTVLVTYDGRTQNLKEWGDEVGLTPTILSKRLNVGWTPEEALTTPYYRSRRKVTKDTRIKRWAI